MRFIPWVFSIAFCTSLLMAGQTLAETSDSDDTQHDALDDAALEEKYGIKAGALQRDESASNGAEETSDAESNNSDNEKDTEGGTGGTGSAEDAVESGEDEQSNDDNE
ncbi:hypothetical protein [Halomonas sp. TD01]|uniref:hypothetical protein n=1 Tax=Halomonas sp. TD01 TaxID=999141 RepID=UPI000214E63C|nr:hypothetical protein [Halomonas sp. TD01]EGP17949.1 hypothetical protein GME_19017 [Halomonas sp. TD01]CAH1042629.1 hypothetical protein HPTD01_1107 [Halomonas sp. TD01]